MANIIEQDTSGVYQPKKNETELVNERTETFKKFSLGNGQFRVAGQVGAIHYKEDYSNDRETFKEIDLTPVDMGDHLLVDKVPTIIKIYKDKVGYEIESRRTGSKWSVELADTKPDEKDVEFEVIPGIGGVRLWKHIKTATAPTKFKWKITELVKAIPSLKLREEPESIDNANEKVELLTNKTLIDSKSFYWEEEVKGLVNKTKQIQYPLHIDTDMIEEQVAASLDDATVDHWASSFNLTATYASMGNGGSGGVDMWMRFTGIPLPNAPTSVDSASLSFKSIANEGVTTCNLKIRANDVDDAAQVANYSGYAALVWTTAQGTWNNVGTWDGSSWYQSVDIAAVVAEILARGGWAENNDMAFQSANNSSSSYAYRSGATWNYSGNVSGAKFNCSYTAGGGTIALTGTITSSTTESDIVTGGKTIILTITGDTWVADGATFNAQRQNIINGIDSAQSETHGWDAEVKAKIGVTDVVRTSDTVCTITLDAEAGYDITATETITATIPATALTGNAQIVASPTFTVSPVGAATGFMTTNTKYWGT